MNKLRYKDLIGGQTEIPQHLLSFIQSWREVFSGVGVAHKVYRGYYLFTAEKNDYNEEAYASERGNMGKDFKKLGFKVEVYGRGSRKNEMSATTHPKLRNANAYAFYIREI